MFHIYIDQEKEVDLSGGDCTPRIMGRNEVYRWYICKIRCMQNKGEHMHCH